MRQPIREALVSVRHHLTRADAILVCDPVALGGAWDRLDSLALAQVHAFVAIGRGLAGVLDRLADDEPESEPAEAMAAAAPVDEDLDPSPDELGRGAYHAYGLVVGNLNYRGDPMPAWDALPETTRRAWVTAALWARR